MLPVSLMNNIRQRGEETPSHPGGLSEMARKKLEEHRKNREKQRGSFGQHLVMHIIDYIRSRM